MQKVVNKTIGDMELNDIDGDYKTAVIRHFDGNQRTVYYTDKETLFMEDEKICSCTDAAGVITMVNSAFVRLSGYSKNELIGVPHYILHHPDMPSIAFASMWETLRTDGKWQGYVKNLRKDGGYYWVFASIFSNFRNRQLVGYTSSRIAAPRDKVAIYSQKYAELLATEQHNGK